MSALTPEGKVKTLVRRELILRGAYYFFPVQAGYGAATVDILACVPRIIGAEDVGKRFGIFYGIETKAFNGQATARQQLCLDTINTASGIAGVVRDETSLAELFARK